MCCFCMKCTNKANLWRKLILSHFESFCIVTERINATAKRNPLFQSKRKKDKLILLPGSKENMPICLFLCILFIIADVLKIVLTLGNNFWFFQICIHFL